MVIRPKGVGEWTSTGRLVANGEARDERRDRAVAPARAGTRGTTVDGSRGGGRGRGRSQQGSHGSLVGEDAGETLDAAVGAGAALEHVEGLDPSRGRVDHLGDWSGLRTCKRGRGGHCDRVDGDGGAVEGEKSDEVEGDEGLPGGGDDKLGRCRSGVDCCCDVDVKCGQAL